ncbi:hypothetical protein CERSUDRAFT_142553 [Gelatoporia subvermispora B]|uniref:LsmAD domain-containing protein n=1 Tax=Ceriporiopsis subvermispora (strain B) TaxID=914234 RepID=M2Q9J5_CERS8|nr:hypothetical protein CERSUDRAFT_142553 [Gelatoporia subvermispora B]
MAATARQPKPQRKGMPEPAVRRPPAWTGARGSPTFSPGPPNTRGTNGGQAPAPSFPPLANGGSSAGTRPGDAPHDRMLQQLSGLTGTTITLTTRTHTRYEGVVAATGPEGDTLGVSLRNVRDLGTPGAPLRDHLFVAATNIETWLSGPADARAPTDSFKTDTDISQKTAPRRERELQAWQPPSETPASAGSPTPGATSPPPGPGRAADEETFGPGAGAGGAWDQFAANERLFGVRAGFDEDVYTTRIDRSAPDFKERERRAALIASEIMGTVTSNPHIAEERVQNLVGDAGGNEEDKYGAVVRSANAYVPPGARKGTQADGAKPVVPKVSVNGPDGSVVQPAPAAATASANAAAPAVKAQSQSPSPAPAGTAKPAADAVPAFRDFVSNEKDRLMKKKQQLMKSEMDKRVADLVKFSKSFKLNKPIPDDLVPILAKDEEKQRQIKEKSTRDAESTQARTIGTSASVAAAAAAAPQHPTPPGTSKPSGTPRPAPPAPQPGVGAKSAPPTKAGEAKSGRISMVIQQIPAFKGKRMSTPATNGAPAGSAGAANGQPARPANAAASSTPLSPTSANRLNVNASSFRPTVKSFSPAGSPNPNGVSSPSPKNKSAEPQAQTQTQTPPNPFFGTRVIKKGPPVHIKDDFNPFKFHNVAEASAVAAMWQYHGKRYMQMFPPLQVPAQPQSPHLAPHVPPPTVQSQTYEEDPNAQAAARGYVYAYQPYPYPGQVRLIVMQYWWHYEKFVPANDARHGAAATRRVHPGTVHAAHALSSDDSQWRSHVPATTHGPDASTTIHASSRRCVPAPKRRRSKTIHASYPHPLPCAGILSPESPTPPRRPVPHDDAPAGRTRRPAASIRGRAAAARVHARRRARVGCRRRRTRPALEARFFSV